MTKICIIGAGPSGLAQLRAFEMPEVGEKVGSRSARDLGLLPDLRTLWAMTHAQLLKTCVDAPC